MKLPQFRFLVPAVLGALALVLLTAAQPTAPAEPAKPAKPASPHKTLRDRLEVLGRIPHFSTLPLKPLGEVALADDEMRELEGIYGQVRDEVAKFTDPAAGAQRRLAWMGWSEAAEQFVADHPNSAWTPSVSLQLGGAYAGRMNYSNAVVSFRRAWQLTHERSEARAREIAVEAGRELAELLVVSGQNAEFDQMVAEEKARDPQHSKGVWPHARELRSWIIHYPGEAYKCGLQCLDQLAKLTQPNAYPPQLILMQPSDPQGYDAGTLLKVGRGAGSPVRAVLLGNFAILPVPCIVHLGFGHYVVVRQKDGDFYQVLDPVKPLPVWLTAAELAPEASGLLIISDRSSTTGVAAMRSVSDSQATLYRGRCYHGTPAQQLAPPPSKPCPKPPGISAASVTKQDESGGFNPKPSNTSPSGKLNQPCSACGAAPGPRGAGLNLSSGMPVWWIAEPNLDFWVQDTPLLYHPKYGPDVAFTLTYQMGGNEDTDSSFHPANRIRAGFNSWLSCSWLGFIDYDNGSGNQAQIHLPGGAQTSFTFTGGSSTSNSDYWTHAWLEKRFTSGTLVGFWLHESDGGQTEFMYVSPDNDPLNADNYFFMTAERDPHGLATTYQFDGSKFLTNVVAADGVSFQVLNNDPTYASITQITNSLGLNVTLGYGETNATPDGSMTYGLSSITDTAGITSYLALSPYNLGDNYIQTPYGRTYIQATGVDLDGTDPNPNDTIERYAQITYPDGSQEAYAQMSLYTGSDWPNWAAGQIPDTSAAFVSTLDTGDRQGRNTFYWPPQTRALMTKDLSTGPTMTWADFKLARIRHWLTHTEDSYTSWGTLSLEQALSPDGSAEGAVTWYDYAGKPAYENDNRGTEAMPSVEARVMPDGTTWWQSTTRNSLGNPLLQTERWYQGGSYQIRTNSFTYTSDGIDLVSHTGPDGVPDLGYGYDSYRRLTSFTNALSEVTTYTYDSNNRPTGEHWPSGLGLTNFYSTDGLTRTNIGYLSGTAYRTNTVVRSPGVTYSRTGLNGVSVTEATTWLVTTDERGLGVTNIYDALDRLWERRLPNGLVEQRHYELFPGQSYASGAGGALILDLTAVINIAGGTNYSTNSLTYDSLRRLGYSGDARGTFTAFSYCDCGAVAQSIRGYGLSLAETNSFSHDLQGNRIWVGFPDGSAVTNTFDALGRLTLVADALGKTTNVYDNLNRLSSANNAFGQLGYTIFDSRDRTISVTDRNGVTVTNTFDNLGRLRTRKNLGDNGTEAFGYTANYGAATSYTNQVGNVTAWAYDVAQRKTTEVVVGLMTNSFTYNGANDLLELYDGKQTGTTNRTRWTYDTFGRVSLKQYANGVTNLTYDYDALSRLTNRWSQAKGNTKYAYDRAGNLTNVDYPSSTDLKYQYDALNRVTNMVDAAGTTKYAYAGGLLTSEDGPWASDTVSYSYNGARMRNQLAIAQPTGNAWTNTYTYDAAKRLAYVTSPAGSFTNTYVASLNGVTGPSGLLLKRGFVGGSYITNQYDSNGRLTDTSLMTNGVVLNQHGYLYDAHNERIWQSRTNAANPSWAGYTTNTYDVAGEARMIRAYGGGTNIPSLNYDYGYDPAWNMATRTNNATVTSYTLNSLNQVTSDGSSYSYDNNGNRTSGPGSPSTVTYEYDDENQLIAASVPLYWKQAYTYDGRQRARVRQDYTWDGLHSAWSLSTTTYLVYDGQNLLQERTSSNNPSITYTRGIDLSGSRQGAAGIGGLFGRTEHSTTTNYQASSSAFYQADGNGNVVAMMDSTPALVGNYRYNAFGGLLASSGTKASVNLMRFSSKPLWAPNAGNGGSGLYYYGYRFYDPSVGRWLSRDPLGEIGGKNLYRFNYNNPLKWIDPDGRSPEGAIIGGGIGGVVGGVIGGLFGGTIGIVLPPLEPITITVGANEGAVLGAAAGAWIGSLFPSRRPPVCIANHSSFPDGFMPGPAGAREWARRNGEDPDEAERRFHRMKGKDSMSGATDDYGVNPDTGEVIDPEGDSIGEL